MIRCIEKHSLKIRAGCHTGPVVAGVIGKTKFAFDCYGDSVNMASRMESTGIPGSVQVSRETYSRIFDLFEFEERTNVMIKGKGSVTTYVVRNTKQEEIVPLANTLVITEEKNNA